MKRLEYIDFARFFAAIMVVAFHYTYNGIANGKVISIDVLPAFSAITRYGYLGVDLFFMISGYVIFFSAKSRTAAQFAFSRCLRLYPAYWVAVLLTSIFSFFIGSKLMSTDLKTTLINLTMLQYFFDIKDVDGVYWTLVYEIKFYFIIFCILLLGLRKHLDLIIKIWSVVIFISLVFNMENLSFIGGYFSFFVSGALLSILREKRGPVNYTLIALTFLSCAMNSLEYVKHANMVNSANYSGFVTVLILAIFFIFFIFQNTENAQEKKFRHSKIAGNLTYPIYLIHAHIGYMLINTFANNNNYIYVYTVIIIFILSVAFLIHYYIEVKMASMWRKLFTISIRTPIETIVDFTTNYYKKKKST